MTIKEMLQDQSEMLFEMQKRVCFLCNTINRIRRSQFNQGNEVVSQLMMLLDKKQLK